VTFAPDASRAFVISRNPDAVLVIDLDRGRSGTASIERVIDLGVGPSRIAFAEIAGRPMVFVSCFDTRDLYVVDVELGTLQAVARGLSGPFEIQVDAARQRVYVVDFRSSVIRVVDLRPLEACLSGAGTGDCVPKTIALIGEPRPVETLR
jgi:DNA-binding beta-propeller fold protein YncE